MSSSNDGLDSCGCCGAGESAEEHFNQPGLDEIRYRIGTHSTFLRRMLSRIPEESIEGIDGREIRPLRGLTTRSAEDPTVALLDAWAITADVLTFYQERIANEGFLRTATERRSVLELARSIGYELKPGVAASTWLAFKVDDAPGAPGRAAVPLGTQVMSIPPQGKLPQIFETVEDIETRVEWNALRPRSALSQKFVIVDNQVRFSADPAATNIDRIYLAGVQTNLKPGDVMVVADGLAANKENQKAAALRVREVVKESELNRTRVELMGGTANRNPIVGLDTPPGSPYTLTPDDLMVSAPVALTREAVEQKVMGRNWRERDLAVYLQAREWNEKDVLALVTAIQNPAREEGEGTFALREKSSFFGHNAQPFGMLPKPENLRSDPYSVADSNWDADNVGTGRTIWKDSWGKVYSTAYSGRHAFLERIVPNLVERSWAVFEGGPLGPVPVAATVVLLNDSFDDTAEVAKAKGGDEEEMKATAPPGETESIAGNPAQPPAAPAGLYPYWIKELTEASLVGFGMSAKANGLTLQAPNRTSDPDTSRAFRVRSATAHIRGELLDLAGLPFDEPLRELKPGVGAPNATPEARIRQYGTAHDSWRGSATIELDGMVFGLKPGQSIIVTGIEFDPRYYGDYWKMTAIPGAERREAAELEDVTHYKGRTTLHLAAPLDYQYVRRTVTITANVAYATHGETVREVLGSGDGIRANQHFTLKKPPLTYTPASTPSGTESTLDLRVQDVLWRETPSLYALAPNDKVYTVRIDDDGRASVIFGDGSSGARLPSGVENVTAVYRSGIGLDGEVGAGALTLLKTKPLGIRGVDNPLAAEGAAAPETRDKARVNAPRTVLTFDRIVSLRDFEDFTRSYAGIGKAAAMVLWRGEQEYVHITVGSESGKPFSGSSETLDNLRAAIDAARDPVQIVRVASYVPRYFRLKGTVLIDPAYLESVLLEQIRGVLGNAFTFENRSFAQPAFLAEVVALAQGVAGVVSVDVDQFHFIDEAPGLVPADTLSSRGARWGAGGAIDPAELLLIDPSMLFDPNAIIVKKVNA